MAITEKTFLIGAASGSGYDGYYPTFSDYQTAQAQDLVTAEERHILYLKADTTTVGPIGLDSASWVTSEDCRIEIKPQNTAEGIAIGDTDIDASITARAQIEQSSGYVVDLTDDIHVYISDILFTSTGATGNIGINIGDDSPAKITNCILRQKLTADAAVTAKGITTGTGFIGKLINVCVVTCVHGTDDYVAAVGFNVNCASRHDAVVNCTAITAWDDADYKGFVLNNYARAVNCLGANSAGALGVDFASDSNGNASVKCCAAVNGDFEDIYGLDNVKSCIEDLTYADLFADEIGELAGDSSLRKKGCLPDCDDTTVDAFGTNRIKYDIGFYQTNLINSHDIEVIFKDMGVIIQTVNKYEVTMPATIESDSEARALQLTSGTNRLAMLSTVLGYDRTNQSQIKGWVNNLVSALTTYLQNYVADAMMATSTVVASVLQELDNWLAVNSETVNAIKVDSNVSYDLATDSDVTLGSLVIPENIKPQRIKLVCTSNAVAGDEYWSIAGSEQTFDGVIQTGVTYEASNGLSFVLSLGDYDAWDDTAGSYTAGDIVLSSGVYYECNSTHSVTPGDSFGDYAANWDVIYLVSVGDEIEIDIMADDEATIQMFFRDYFNFCFDNSDSDGAETILDTWAA